MVVTAFPVYGFLNPVKSYNFRTGTVLCMKSENSINFSIHQTISHSITVLSLSLIIATGVPTVANAGALENVNSKLSDYGMPPVLYVPPGFTPLVSEFGRGNIKEKMSTPIVVQYSHPSMWVEKTTTVNNNGESGTISANDYMKGDSSFLFVTPLPAGEKLTDSSKKLVKS